LKTEEKIKLTKSARCAAAESFILSAKEILLTEYGCKAEIAFDMSSVRNLSLSSEYFNQITSILALIARGGKDSGIKFESDGDELTISLHAPDSVYASDIHNSFLADSSADLGDFAYSARVEGGDVEIVLRLKLKKSAAIALYAISPSDISEIIRRLISE
jgi:hypothetical protein